MNKVFLSILVVLLFAISFASAADLTITDTVNATGVSVNPAESFSGSFKVNNVNPAETISNIDISSTSFSGPNTIPASAIVFSPDPISSIVPNGTQSVSFTVTMPTYQIPGFYAGTVTAADSLGNTTSMPLSFTVNTLQKVEVTDHSASAPLILTGEEDNIVSGTFTIKNSGNVDLSFSDASITHNVDLSDPDGDNITLTFSSIPATLTPGSTDQITATASIANNVDIDTYSGTVTITSAASSANFSLEVRVQPEVCEDGVVGNLDLTIEDPDNGDEFAPGETIELDVSVENNDNDELDVIVTAFLYNINEDDNIVEEDSETIEISDGDEESFTLDLVLPLNGNLNDEDEYKIFIKSYEDGDEDQNCDEDSIDIDIEREKHDTRVDDFTLSPSIVSCGDVVEAEIDIVNIGSSNEDDVYVELKNSELELSEKSEEFDLDNGNDKDNDATQRMTFTVPQDASEKTYQIEAIVYYDDGDEKTSKFATLSVEDCGAAEEPEEQDSTELPKADIEVLSSSIEAKDNSFSVPVKITNNEASQETYTVDMSNIADWAEPVSAKTLTLNAAQSSTLYFYVKANKDTYGKQSATISVKDQAGKTLTTQTLALDLGEKPSEPVETSTFDTLKGYFSSNGSSSTVFWIVLDVVLVIVAIVFLKVLFTRKK